MKVFNNFTKLIIFPVYYVVHKNLFIGVIHKFFIKNFYYKNFKFELNIKGIPLSSRSSFFFKTYEYNDRKLVEKYIFTGAGGGVEVAGASGNKANSASKLSLT